MTATSHEECVFGYDAECSVLLNVKQLSDNEILQCQSCLSTMKNTKLIFPSIAPSMLPTKHASIRLCPIELRRINKLVVVLTNQLVGTVYSARKR